jgi:hypothetical protein
LSILKNFHWWRSRKIGSDNLHRTFRQRVKKRPAVLLRQNPVVQNHDVAGVDLLPQKKYFCRMETVTLKMERRHIALLKGRAKALGRSQAAVVRDLIDQHLGSKKHPSLHDLAKDFCGSLSGPKDMSTRKLTGYGRD